MITLFHPMQPIHPRRRYLCADGRILIQQLPPCMRPVVQHRGSDHVGLAAGRAIGPHLVDLGQRVLPADQCVQIISGADPPRGMFEFVARQFHISGIRALVLIQVHRDALDADDAGRLGQVHTEPQYFLVDGLISTLGPDHPVLAIKKGLPESERFHDSGALLLMPP